LFQFHNLLEFKKYVQNKRRKNKKPKNQKNTKNTEKGKKKKEKTNPEKRPTKPAKNRGKIQKKKNHPRWAVARSPARVRALVRLAAGRRIDFALSIHV
jgi:outer membrane biosynthesis protein TonB